MEVANGEIVRDQYGNAKGGIRSPYLDMPAYRYTPSTSRGSMIGVQSALPPDTVKSLYNTRASYLKLFNAQIDKMVAGRFLLPVDAKKLKEEEEKDPPL
jgi:hypothetical protein